MTKEKKENLCLLNNILANIKSNRDLKLNLWELPKSHIFLFIPQKRLVDL